MRKAFLFAVLLVFLVAGAASASHWNVVIGDVDGFGFNGADGPDPVTNAGAPWAASATTAAGGLRKAVPALPAAGLPADTDLDGILEIPDGPGSVITLLKHLGVPVGTAGDEYLPDINGDGYMRSNSRDIWDNRTAGELANTAVTAGNGAVDAGSIGSKWTDVSIADLYDSAIGPPPPPNVLTADNVLNTFPDAAGSAQPNNAVFSFNFTIPKPNAYTGKVAFALIFGDYDVTPARVNIWYTGGPPGAVDEMIPLVPQSNPTGEDGLIQAAVAYLPFNKVFTDGGATWNGSVSVVMLDAPMEPYYAIDAVILAGTQIPEPGTYALFGLGVLGLLAWRRRRVG